MGHDHSHGPAAIPDDDAAARSRLIRRMLLALALLASFLIAEIVVGVWSDSLALLADAGHMATDVFALGMGLAAVILGARGSKVAARTFGWHRAEVFTALINAALLIGVAAWVLYEAVSRWDSDAEPVGWALIVTALAGLAINLIALQLLRGDAKSSLAVKGAYLEVMADAVGSVGVLIAGIITATTQWRYADLVVAVLIALWVVPRALALASGALRILVQQSPKHVDVAGLEAGMRAIDGVDDVHDLHIWTLTTGKDVATVHLTSNADPSVVLGLARDLFAGHGLDHATIQVEPPASAHRCEHELNY